MGRKDMRRDEEKRLEEREKYLTSLDYWLIEAYRTILP